MDLLPKKVEEKLPKLYATDGVHFAKKKAVVKYFTPYSNWTWYAVEGERTEDGDFRFFGYVEGFENEWGYFHLSELEASGVTIERDLYFEPQSMSDILKHER